MEQATKQRYSVIVLKRDQEHIFALETDNFDEADALWTELKDKWAIALHEQKPFILRKPIITAFDPGLIYEVTVRLIETSLKTNADNPYQKQMQDRGFAATFSNYAKGAPILDGGYK